MTAPPQGRSRRPPRPNGGPLRVLLAEDNATNQRVVLAMLEHLGQEADVASNGIEAVEMVAAKTYDVVFMDLQMPKLGGLDAAKQIVEGMSNPPQIIAMTADALDSDRQRCIEAGMHDYISKPVRVDTLERVLRMCEQSVDGASPGD